MHELSKIEGQLLTLSLDRGDLQANFGFSLRGGVEHGVGHFVSSVDSGSVAESQGMKAGDQFLSVERLPLASATHKEAVALISSRKKIEIEIKRVGAIPVKKSKGDSIQWIQCDEESAQKLLQQENHLAVERIVIDLGDHFSKNGLGCSIWKGPPERPGIYVQSIKSQGAGHVSGLQLGDQILRCNQMSFEGQMDFSLAVAQIRAHRILDLIVKRGAGLDLIYNEEQEKQFEDEKRLLQSQVNLERRKLEAEQERLRQESVKLEAEKAKLKEERKRLAVKSMSEESTTSTTSAGDSSSLESSSSATGGLANAIQSELKRRAEGKPLPIKSIVKNSPTTTHLAGNSNSNNPTTTTKKPPNTITTLIHPDQHNQLMAEFRQVHKKMFTLSGITEDSEATTTVESSVISSEATTDCRSRNRSYDETLVKAPAKATPPTPPTRTCSMASSQSGSGSSPELSSAIIPTPDYGSSSSQDEADRSSGSGLQLKNPRTKTFSKRHPPHVPEIFESFNPIDENQELLQHPPYYFDPPKPMVSIYDQNSAASATENNSSDNGRKFQFQPKNVRFDTSVEHHLASHDYRVAHATRKALRYTSEMHKQLALRSGLNHRKTTGSGSAASGSSSGISSSNMSSPRNLSSSEEEIEQQQQQEIIRHQRAKSPKKYPAPPPPPPPPAPPKNVMKGIH